MKLDAKDKQLLYLLDFDARATYTQLAKQLRMSKQGVEYKIKSLQEKNVIQGFYPVINVPRLGYKYCRLCLSLKGITKETHEKLLDYLIADDRFFWIFTGQGTFDLLIAMWVKSLVEFRQAVDDLLEKFGKYIRVKHESIATDVIHYQSRYLLQTQKTREIHIKDTTEIVILDDLDREILKTLCKDARASLVSMGQQLNVSAKVVSYRIKQLEQKKIIEGYRPIINHLAFGFTYYKLWIHLYYESADQMKRLYEYLRNSPLVLYVVEGIGMLEGLDIELFVQDNEQLYKFITDLRLKFPDIVGDYKTNIFLETKKVRYLPF